MQFEKKVIYLGHKDMKMRDGSVLFSISFYVDDSTLEVNVLATNEPVMGVVRELSFGDTCTATFMLRKTDKLYKLSLLSLA